MRIPSILLGCCGALLFANEVLAQQSPAASIGMFAYPSAGQTPEQQAKDEQECYAWARQATNIDPTNPSAAQQPAAAPQQDTAASAGRSGLRGAAAGALIANATDNDWEDYAAAGAVIGASRGARGARQRNAQAQQQATQQQQQAATQQIETFKKAFSACVEGRQYTIK